MVLNHHGDQIVEEARLTRGPAGGWEPLHKEPRGLEGMTPRGVRRARGTGAARARPLAAAARKMLPRYRDVLNPPRTMPPRARRTRKGARRARKGAAARARDERVEAKSGAGGNAARLLERVGPQLDVVLAARLRNVLELRNRSTKSDTAVQRYLRRKGEDARRRDAQRRALFVERRQREADQARAAEARRARAAERGARHAAKVDEIRAQRFWADMERQEAARRTRRLAREAELFKGLFLEAVEAEKERVLSERAAERRQRDEDERYFIGHERQQRALVRDHLEMLEDAVVEERRDRLVAEKDGRAMQREIEREGREALARDRQALLEIVNGQEEAAYIRSMDPKLVAPHIRRQLTSIIEKGI